MLMLLLPNVNNITENFHYFISMRRATMYTVFICLQDIYTKIWFERNESSLYQYNSTHACTLHHDNN